MARARRRLAAGGVLMLLSLVAAGCLPNESSSADSDQPASEAAAEPEAAEESDGGDDAQAEGDTLLVWDIFAREGESAVVDQLNDEFEQEHGVTIEREARPLDDLKVTLPQAMGQEDGPDVASVNQGQADMGTMVEAGLLLDVTAFAEERGWNEAFGELLLQRNSFEADGTGFGGGNVYGIAPQAEVVGFFYNKEKLEALGEDVPETFEELEALLAAASEAGETPINFGNSDAWPGIHTYGSVEHTLVDTDYLNEWIFHQGDATFDRPENVQAAELVRDWAEAGYFTENYEGIGYDDSVAAFSSGEGLLMLTGSWVATELEDPSNFGFFTVPGVDGDPAPQTGGQGVPFAVRAGTQSPELAMEYVDWMVSERAAELWSEAGALPSRTPPEGSVEEGSLQADLVEAFTTVTAEDQLGHYLDWASPTMYDAISAGVQELLAGSADPETFVQTVQSAYEE